MCHVDICISGCDPQDQNAEIPSLDWDCLRQLFLGLTIAWLSPGLLGCSTPVRSVDPHITHHPRPESRYSYVGVKRYSPQEVPQILPGSRCTVETVGGQRSVTGFVQSASRQGIVLVHAEEIVPKAEVPSSRKGDGYSHTARSEISIQTDEIAQVRVFQE